MKPSVSKISISVESYDEKTAENDRNGYITEKHIIFKLSNQTILELFECHRGDLYMTINRNFVRFAHS